MNHNVSAYKALQIAKAFDEDLRADHPGFSGSVQIVNLDDYSVSIINGAFVREVFDYYCVHSEHQELQVHHKDDVVIQTFKQVPNDWYATGVKSAYRHEVE